MRPWPWLIAMLAFSGCATSAPPALVVREQPLTLGLVQREIHPGMDSGAVAEVLGPPNLVSKDATGRETWVYDKAASESDDSEGGVAGTAILFSGYHDEHHSAQTERTLTVVIKFTDKGLVDSVTYHASRF